MCRDKGEVPVEESSVWDTVQPVFDRAEFQVSSLGREGFEDDSQNWAGHIFCRVIASTGR